MLSTGQHTLTTQPDPNESYKHCIVVKLTDSSVKAIEEYLRNKVIQTIHVSYDFIKFKIYFINKE
jgi:hypothetical protein